MLKRAISYLEELRQAVVADSKGWLICAAVLFITVIRSGITYSFGVFVAQLRNIYKRPMSEISECLYCIFTPFSQWYLWRQINNAIKPNTVLRLAVGNVTKQSFLTR